jgi:WD40 repeat protein
VRFVSPSRQTRRVIHTAPVTSAEWAPDGRTLATGSYDGSVVIWRDGGLTAERKLSHPRLVNGVRWSDDGHLLAVACADGHCYVWDIQSRQSPLVLSRHSDDVNSIAWAPGRASIATVSEDGTGRLWSLPGPKLADVVLSHSDHCMSADWQPSGDRIATCGEDATVRIWASDGRLVSSWLLNVDSEMVRWSPRGDLLAIACDDRIVRVVTENGAQVTELGPHAGAAKSVAWHPAGGLLAVGSYDCAVSLWRIPEGVLEARSQHPRMWPRALHWAAGGDRIVCGSQGGNPVLLAVEAAGGNMQLRRLDAPEVLTVGINAVTWAGSQLICGLDDGTVRVWQPTSSAMGVLPGTEGGDAGLVNTVAFSPRQRRIAFGRFSGDVTVVTLAGAALQASVGAPVNSVEWSPDGSLLAVADYSGVVTVLSPNSGELALVGASQPHDAAVKSLAWLDNSTMVTGSTDRSLRLITIGGEVLRTLVGHGNLINAVAVTSSIAEPLIASASRDRTVRVWDPRSGECLRVLTGHDESVKSVTWKPRSRTTLASGSYDFDVRIWDLRKGDPGPATLAVIPFHSQGVGGLNWGRLGLATASWDGALAIWKVTDRGRVSLVASTRNDAR